MSITYPDDGGSRILSNVSTILPDYMALQMEIFKGHVITANEFSSTADGMLGSLIPIS
jgi:hypothetical protein